MSIILESILSQQYCNTISKALLVVMAKEKFMIKNWPGGFTIVDANKVFKGQVATWQYAFVNKSKQLYALRFDSIEQFRQARFDAEYIAYGSEQRPNPWHNMSDEQILIGAELEL